MNIQIHRLKMCTKQIHKTLVQSYNPPCFTLVEITVFMMPAFESFMQRKYVQLDTKTNPFKGKTYCKTSRYIIYIVE